MWGICSTKFYDFTEDFCKSRLIKEFSARNGFANYFDNIFITGVQKRDEGESWLRASLHEITEVDYDRKNEKVITKKTKSNFFLEIMIKVTGINIAL